MHHNSDILMYDGSIRKIDDINIGDEIMGPDSLPRTVLSKTLETGQIYEITPFKGRSFKCSGSHKLILKARSPLLRSWENKFGVIYTQRGKYKCKLFNTKLDASRFFYSLKEDIFEVSLEKYLNWPDERKNECYLFHTPIDFRFKEIPVDPQVLIDIIGFYIKHSKIIKLDVLKYMGINFPRIPYEYLTNTSSVRKKIFKGLLSYMQSFELYHELKINRNPELCNDIEYLCFSLGIMVIRSEPPITINDKNIKSQSNFDILRIFIKPSDDFEKQLAYSRSLYLKQKFSVKPINQGYFYNFKINNDGRFLLSDFLITHG